MHLVDQQIEGGILGWIHALAEALPQPVLQASGLQANLSGPFRLCRR